MHKGLFSLRAAVIMSFLIIMIGVIAVFVILDLEDYEWLAQEQGGKLLESLYLNTENELINLLTEPERANRYYEDLVSRASYDASNLEEVEALSLGFLKLIHDELPQVSALSIGNESGHFVGYRVNDDGTYSLMLSDERTDEVLKIYANETIKSEELAAFEGYDPRTRPWYAPVKEEAVNQWSDIYVNFDEIHEMTITSLFPILDENEGFKGVAGMDIKLNNIGEFLTKDQLKGNGVIYIVDENWQIVSNSCCDDYVEIIESEPPEARRIKAFNSQNKMMKMSADFIVEQGVELGEVFQMTIEGEHYYGLYSPLTEPSQLQWRIVGVIPETDIMGTIKDRQQHTLVVTMVFLMASSFGGMLLLSIMTKPILEGAEAAIRIADGEWDISLTKSKLPLYEIDELVKAFNTMTTKLRESFELVQSSEEKYRSLVESAEDDIYSLNPEGIVISVNKSIEDTLNRNRDEIVGQYLWDLFLKATDRELWKAKFEMVMKDKETLAFQFESSSGIRGYRIVNVKMIPLLDSNGEIERILGTNINVTELIEARVQIEKLLTDEKIELERIVAERTAELEVTMKELMEQERLASLGTLVTGVAHEVNTPIGVAFSAGSFASQNIADMTRDFTDNKLTKRSMEDYIANVEESVRIINSNLNKASNLIQSFKKIAVDQNMAINTEFNLYELLNTIILAMRHDYKDMDYGFTITCHKDLIIYSDQGAYSQIITQLITNTLVHGFKGRTSGTVEITGCIQNDGNLKLTFSDNGVGINKEDLKHIFEPFFTTNRTRGGSGLGLNIVYNLITARLGGRITCESEPDAGTRFYLDLPIRLESTSLLDEVLCSDENDEV